MIDEELLSKFDRIQELAVSEELLGAYLEGNLSDSKLFEVESQILLNPNLNYLLNHDYADLPILPPELDLDSIPFNLDNTSESMNASFNYDDLSDIKIYGESGSIDGSSNPLINQFYPDTCAIRSQQIILRDYGIDISQEDLAKIAYENGWYAPGGGTPMECVGNLLNIAGVECHQSVKNTIFDLTNELAQGHRVIVGVDSGELWEKDFWGRLSEKFEDFIGNNSGADHALIVAGVEVNPLDHTDVKVVLTDSGNGNLRVEYSLEEFVDAWKDSNCFMVSTDEPAPYQFDPTTNSEIPSGFSSEFAFNDFVVDNGYQLSPDNFTIPEFIAASYSESHMIEFPTLNLDDQSMDCSDNDNLDYLV